MLTNSDNTWRSYMGTVLTGLEDPETKKDLTEGPALIQAWMNNNQPDLQEKAGIAGRRFHLFCIMGALLLPVFFLSHAAKPATATSEQNVIARLPLETLQQEYNDFKTLAAYGKHCLGKSKQPLALENLCAVIPADLPVPFLLEKELPTKITDADLQNWCQKLSVVDPQNKSDHTAIFRAANPYLPEDLNALQDVLNKIQMNSKNAAAYYALMHMLEAVLTKHNIPYWAEGGTLLGAHRHKGIIPIDDDIDLFIHQKNSSNLMRLKEELQSFDISLKQETGAIYAYYKPKRDKDLCVFSEIMLAQESHPKPLDGGPPKKHWTYREDFWFWQKYFHTSQELSGLKKVPFGPTEIFVPQGTGYLDRGYPGWQNWMTVTHIHRKSVKQNFKDLLPIYIPFPETYGALPWDEQLFSAMTAEFDMSLALDEAFEKTAASPPNKALPPD